MFLNVKGDFIFYLEANVFIFFLLTVFFFLFVAMYDVFTICLLYLFKPFSLETCK